MLNSFFIKLKREREKKGGGLLIQGQLDKARIGLELLLNRSF
jgi:hypothetical protein